MKLTGAFPKFGRGHSRVWWLLLVYLSLASIVDVGYAPVFGFSGAMRACFLLTVSALKASLLLVMAICLWQWRPMRAFVIAGCILFATAAIVNCGSWRLYGFGISRKLLNLMAQTNSTEVAELIPDVIFKLKHLFSNWQTLAATALGLIAIPGINCMPVRAFRLLAATLSSIGLILTVWFAARFSTGRSALLLSVRIPKYAYDMVQSNRELQAYVSNMPPLPDMNSVRSRHLANDVILVIGESASRDNLSVYGYPLATSPQMDRRADSLFVFTNVISSSAYTLQSIENMMTFRPDNAAGSQWHEFPRVIDLFNQAGYRTYWLSNQERTGWWASSLGALSSTAKTVRYIGMEYQDDAMLANTTLDELLLPPARDAMADSAANRMIVLHLMGSHWTYSERFPAERAKFDADSVLQKLKAPWLNREKAGIVADYANSIAYTDSIWGELAGMIEHRTEPSLLIYLSDHGENVFDDRDFRGRDEAHVRIPFVILANGAYRDRNPQIVRMMAEATGRPFSSAALVQALMTLTGTSYALYDAAADPLSPCFSEKLRFVDDEPWIFDKKLTETNCNEEI